MPVRGARGWAGVALNRAWVPVLAVALMVGLPLPTAAQEEDQPASQDQFPVTAPDTAILTVDFEALFSQSAFGRRLVADYVAAREALAEENRRIFEGLRAEELSLAERRPEMDPDVFREEAKAFDEKAIAIRQAQDAKEQDIERILVDGRDAFLVAARPILGDLLLERRATVMLDQRNLIVSLNRIDVTAEAIVRIDAELGDGAGERNEQEGNP